jgi:hypothetical protein
MLKTGAPAIGSWSNFLFPISILILLPDDEKALE